MKVLLVDNGTHYKQKLANLLAEHDIVKINHDELDLGLHDQGFDMIVLSGAYGTRSVKYAGDTLFAHEQEFIKSAKVPVIALCFAAQLVAHMYGARLSFFVRGGARIKGLKTIWNVNKNAFDFFPYYGARVWASQRWRITELPDVLECMCASNEGVEVFRHKNRPIYGLQFHPERRAENNDGARIFNKIIEIEINK